MDNSDTASTGENKSNLFSFFESYGALLQRDFGHEKWLVDHLLPEIGCGFIAGPPKQGKTWLALDLAIAVATGQNFLGQRISESKRVVYIGAEGSGATLRDRLIWLINGRGLEAQKVNEHLYLGLSAKLRIDKAESLAQLEALIESVKPSLVILDPMSRMHQKDENKSNEMESVLQELTRISMDNKLCLVVVHHSTKEKTENFSYLRGSSALNGWHDAMIGVRKVQQTNRCKLKFVLRDADPPPVEYVTIDIFEEKKTAKILLETKQESRERNKAARTAASNTLAIHETKVLDHLRQSPHGLSKSRLSKELKINNDYITLALESLERQDLISKTKGLNKGAKRNRTKDELWCAAPDKKIESSNDDFIFPDDEFPNDYLPDDSLSW